MMKRPREKEGAERGRRRRFRQLRELLYSLFAGDSRCDLPCNVSCDTPCDESCDERCDDACDRSCDESCQRPCDEPCDDEPLVINGPRELWYFNGETPPGYAVVGAYSSNKAGGTFFWESSAHFDLDAPNAPTVNATTLARTATRFGAWVRLTHTDAAGRRRQARLTVTVREPVSITHLRNVDAAEATWGYTTSIHYDIRDQFNEVLPRAVPINEQWDGPIVPDFPGMDWRRGAEGAATVSPADWHDYIEGETAGHVPAPVAPGDPGAATAVYHWPGTWRVGSLTIGSGSNVSSVTWQKNRGFARHT